MAEAGAPGPDDGGGPRPGEVLACVDFSDATDAVVRAAAQLAVVAARRLHLLHVAAEEPDIAGYDRGPVAIHTRDERAGELLEEHHLLRELADRLEAQGLAVIPLLVMGPTVDKIVEEANRIDAAVIVVGSHGHGKLHHLLVGSVSDGVLRHAGRPVTVVPAPDRSA